MDQTKKGVKSLFSIPGNLAGVVWHSTGEVYHGAASFYGADWHGRKTANGEIYDMHSLTAAHRSLPFGTRVRVTNLRNDQSTVVRINNRGPFIRGRIIDLSRGAAGSIGMINSGVARVKLEILRERN